MVSRKPLAPPQTPRAGHDPFGYHHKFAGSGQGAPRGRADHCRTLLDPGRFGGGAADYFEPVTWQFDAIKIHF